MRNFMRPTWSGRAAPTSAGIFSSDLSSQAIRSQVTLFTRTQIPQTHRLLLRDSRWNRSSARAALSAERAGHSRKGKLPSDDASPISSTSANRRRPRGTTGPFRRDRPGCHLLMCAGAGGAAGRFAAGASLRSPRSTVQPSWSASNVPSADGLPLGTLTFSGCAPFWECYWSSWCW